ncbi:hypothetical protein H3H54_14445 [Brachybacterium sp. Z12]|nr:hypothetical protein H3H54_14445 [Brachybacterium sp. Z12]
MTIADSEYDKTAVVELVASSRHDDFEHYRFDDHGYAGVQLTRNVLISLRWQVAVLVDSFTADRDVTMSQWWHLSPRRAIGERTLPSSRARRPMSFASPGPRTALLLGSPAARKILTKDGSHRPGASSSRPAPSRR